MAERDPVLAAWQAAGTTLTMLPSGFEVRLEEVPVVEMVRSGVLPGQLRAIAMRFASDDDVDPTAMDLEERERWEELERQMISRWVVAAAWTCSCVECSRRRPEPLGERPYRLTPEALAEDPPPLPRVDIAALRDIVVFARTALMVDATSRVAHGQMEPDAAWRIIEGERANTLEGWASFRQQRPSVDGDAQREDVGRTAVGVFGPDAPAPSDHRAAARRGPRHSRHPGAGAGKRRRA